MSAGDRDARPAGGGDEADRRLSALTIFTEPAGYLKGLVVPLGAALVTGGLDPWILILSAVLVAGMLLAGLLTYRSVRYRVGEAHFELRKGIVRKQRRTIPLERIRGVDVSATPLHRLFGLAVVKIEAAAGGRAPEEGKLDAVRLGEAERLQRELLRRRPASEEGADSADTEDELLFAMPRRWYLFGALRPRYLVALLAALAAAGGAALELLTDLGVDIGQVVARHRDWASGGALGWAALAAAALALAPVFAIGAYAIAQWGFSLRRRGGCLVTERGLLTRRQVSLEHARIRGYELADDPLGRLGRAVRLTAIATGIRGGGSRAALLPTGSRRRVHAILAEVLTPFAGGLRAHPPAARRRRLGRAVAPVAGAAVVAALAGHGWVAAALAVAVLPAAALGLDRYRSLGHGFDGQQLSLRSGSLSRGQVVVQKQAIIGWRWTQTLLQRRAGLATLEVAVGAGRGGYAAIDIGLADSVALAHEVTPAMLAPFAVGDQSASNDRSASPEA